MERVPEPELMEDQAQALAYARADFEEPHNHFMELFRECFSETDIRGHVLDLGCGPGDISCRFARAYAGCRVDGVDGAAAMLAAGRNAVSADDLQERVQLHQAYLPDDRPPRESYDGVISNSLLHHLADPQVLWNSVMAYARPGAPVFVMDLLRPNSREAATTLVEQYAAGEPEVLRHDFFHSLLAAYRLDEVRGQLDLAGLGSLRVQAVSDRHWIAWGLRPQLTWESGPAPVS